MKTSFWDRKKCDGWVEIMVGCGPDSRRHGIAEKSVGHVGGHKSSDLLFDVDNARVGDDGGGGGGLGFGGELFLGLTSLFDHFLGHYVGIWVMLFMGGGGDLWCRYCRKRVDGDVGGVWWWCEEQREKRKETRDVDHAGSVDEANRLKVFSFCGDSARRRVEVIDCRRMCRKTQYTEEVEQTETRMRSQVTS